MSTDPLALTHDVERASARLVDNVRRLRDGDAAGPSLLPGWTRGHVLTHVARNADGAVNLLTWARTGVETPQYVSAERRNADIEAGAGRTAAELLDDLVATGGRLVAAIEQMPPTAWRATVRWRTGREAPALDVLWSRLREVEIHHVDLDAGFSPDGWSDAFSSHLIGAMVKRAPSDTSFRVLATDLARTWVIGDDPGESGTTVAGRSGELAWWLTGRPPAESLTCSTGDLPPVKAW
jgi:maleylpyruvate isomerase